MCVKILISFLLVVLAISRGSSQTLLADRKAQKFSYHNPNETLYQNSVMNKGVMTRYQHQQTLNHASSGYNPTRKEYHRQKWVKPVTHKPGRRTLNRYKKPKQR
jgi:hypothetical protein